MGNLDLRSVHALLDKPSTSWFGKQSRKRLSWTLQKEQPCLGRGKDYGWDRNLPPIEDVFINWVWRTHYLALSHPYSSARHIKATSEITTGLPVKKTFGAWAMVEWDWNLGGKQSQVYLQATRMQQFTALLWAARWTHIFMVDIWQ